MHLGAHKCLYTPIEPFKTQLLTHVNPHTVIDSPSGTPTNAFTDGAKFRYSIYIQETDTHVPLITLVLTHRSMQMSPKSHRCKEQLHVHTLKKLYMSRDNIQTQTHMCACHAHAVTPDHTHTHTQTYRPAKTTQTQTRVYSRLHTGQRRMADLPTPHHNGTHNQILNKYPQRGLRRLQVSSFLPIQPHS